jgi:hypothetical protein
MNERYCISPSTATKLAVTLDSKIEDLFEIQINRKEVINNG